MTRVRKTPQARRQEIVDHTLRLFAEHGVDATSVNDIVRAAGVSKGGFYHHFANKHEVIQSIVSRLNEAVVARLEVIEASAELTPLQKLDALFDHSVQAKKRSVGDETLQQFGMTLFNERNLRLRLALEAQALELSLPYLHKIVREGQKAGAFRVDAPLTTARHILLLGSAVTAHAIRTHPDELLPALAAFRHDVDRMLGVSRTRSTEAGRTI